MTTLWESFFDLKMWRPPATVEEVFTIIFITDRKIIFRILNMYKGLHFNFQIASHYFTSIEFFFIIPFKWNSLE